MCVDKGHKFIKRIKEIIYRLFISLIISDMFIWPVVYLCHLHSEKYIKQSSYVVERFNELTNKKVCVGVRTEYYGDLD